MVLGQIGGVWQKQPEPQPDALILQTVITKYITAILVVVLERKSSSIFCTDIYIFFNLAHLFSIIRHLQTLNISLK